MAKVKITVIGGGSYLWSPKLLVDILSREDLHGSTIVLQDIDQEALEDLYQYGQLVKKQTDSNIIIEKTLDLNSALMGADFVIVQITTGGLKTMGYDIEIPMKYGIYQSVGDTVGPGGLSRAMRNIPVFIDIAKRMEKLCPNAWLLNLTNPMTTLTKSIYESSSIHCVGLCHGLFDTLNQLTQILGVEESDFQYRVAGINHFIWITDLKVNGEDGFELLRKALAKGPDLLLRGLSSPSFEINRFQATQILFQEYGAIPCPGDRHIAEFFPNLLKGFSPDKSENDLGIRLTTIGDRKRSRLSRQKKLREIIESGNAPVERSREEISDLIAAMANGRQELHILNLPNKGAISNLPQDAIVETMGVVDAYGLSLVNFGDLPSGICGAIIGHVVNQDLIVKASIKGDKGLALQAFLNDPLCGQISMMDIKSMFDELFEANREFLPQF